MAGDRTPLTPPAQPATAELPVAYTNSCCAAAGAVRMSRETATSDAYPAMNGATFYLIAPGQRGCAL